MIEQLDPQGSKASRRLLLIALGMLALVAIIAAPSCGSDNTSPRDGATDRGPDAGGGGSAGGGGNHDAAVDSQTGGTGGNPDAGVSDAPPDLGPDGDMIVDTGVDATPETCGPDGQGCARLSVPLTDPQTGTFFPISIAPTDLSGVSAVFRFCLVSSGVQGLGWVQPYAQEGVSPYAGQYNVVNFTAIPACPSFLDYTFNFPDAQPPDPASDAGSPWFTRVQNLGLKIQSLDGATGSWANPTVVYVDSVMLYRRTPDADASSDGGAASDDGAASEGGTAPEGGAPDDASAGNDGGAPDDGGAGADGGAPEGGAPGDGSAPPDDADTTADGGADDGDTTTTDAGPPPPLPGPFTFDTSGSPFGVSSYMIVPGSQVDWVP